MPTAGITAALRLRRAPELRSQAARTDPAALAAIYERHHQALYRYCRSILHDDEDARDALQSTMAKALAALRDEQRDFELRPWLFRIAHNEAISRLRQRREVVDLDALDRVGTDSLAQTLEDRERLALLRADLRDLPERQRMALVLRELSGLSHEEIAGVLDSSARAVKQTIFEARAGLQECAEGRTMLCADVQRALSDGDGRVLRGRRMRAHVRSCRACRQFKTALAQRPADLAVLAPALPATAGAALLAHLLPGAKAGLAASAGAAGGAGGGVAATVATKAAIVLVATATLAGTGTVVREVVTAPDRGAHAGRRGASHPARPAGVRTGVPSPGCRQRTRRIRRPRQRPLARADRSARVGTVAAYEGQGVSGDRRVPAQASQKPAGAKGQANAAGQAAGRGGARPPRCAQGRQEPSRPPGCRPAAGGTRSPRQSPRRRSVPRSPPHPRRRRSPPSLRTRGAPPPPRRRATRARTRRSSP